MKTILQSCPSNKNGECFITGNRCEVYHPENCREYQRYAPKHYNLLDTNSIGNIGVEINKFLEMVK